jgi:hypothetical protein
MRLNVNVSPSFCPIKSGCCSVVLWRSWQLMRRNVVRHVPIKSGGCGVVLWWPWQLVRRNVVWRSGVTIKSGCCGFNFWGSWVSIKSGCSKRQKNDICNNDFWGSGVSIKSSCCGVNFWRQVAALNTPLRFYVTCTDTCDSVVQSHVIILHNCWHWYKRNDEEDSRANRDINFVVAAICVWDVDAVIVVAAVTVKVVLMTVEVALGAVAVCVHHGHDTGDVRGTAIGAVVLARV